MDNLPEVECSIQGCRLVELDIVIYFKLSKTSSHYTVYIQAFTGSQEVLFYLQCFWCESTEKCIEKRGMVSLDCKSLNWRYHGNCIGEFSVIFNSLEKQHVLHPYIQQYVLHTYIYIVTTVQMYYKIWCLKDNWLRDEGGQVQG